jgi:hypothetical protein
VHVHVSSPDYRAKYYIKVINKSLEYMAEFKYLGMALTNELAIYY